MWGFSASVIATVYLLMLVFIVVNKSRISLGQRLCSMGNHLLCFLAAPDKKVFGFVSCFYTKCYNKQQILLGGVMMKQIIAMGAGVFRWIRIICPSINISSINQNESSLVFVFADGERRFPKLYSAVLSCI